MAHTKALNWHVPPEVGTFFEVASLTCFYLAFLIILVGVGKALKACAAAKRRGRKRCRNARSKT
jgi:hypothetical protein